MNPRIAIIDYGMGNLRSVAKALERVGADVAIIDSPQDIGVAKGLVLPGVGAFSQAMDRLTSTGFDALVRDWIGEDRPFIGICLGLQLLFSESAEHGRHEGLGIIPGKVMRFGRELTVPHMGWNQVRRERPSPLLEGIADESFFYFAHSYYVAPEDPAAAVGTTEYGRRFGSVIQSGMVFGTQFHPEKSGPTGLRMLANFSDLCRNRE